MVLYQMYAYLLHFNSHMELQDYVVSIVLRQVLSQTFNSKFWECSYCAVCQPKNGLMGLRIGFYMGELQVLFQKLPFALLQFQVPP